MDAALERFSPATRDWFAGAFPAPTPAQTGAWEAIASGRHALVVAPTGSGKTLSAFLWSLDRLATTPRPSNPRHRTRDHRVRRHFLNPADSATRAHCAISLAM